MPAAAAGPAVPVVPEPGGWRRRRRWPTPGRASAAARCSRRTTRGTRRSTRSPCAPTRRTLIANISSPGKTNLHPDFGGGGAYGIPFKVVPATQPKVAINYTAYGDESDPGPFPIPGNAPVEGGSASDGDRHVLVLQQGTCHLYELGRAFWQGNHWNADVGVNWNLNVERVAARWAGRRPTRPGCRSCPGSCATTRSRRGTSITRCASPCRTRRRATSSRRRTTRRRRRTRRCRRWGCACG